MRWSRDLPASILGLDRQENSRRREKYELRVRECNTSWLNQKSRTDESVGGSMAAKAAKAPKAAKASKAAKAPKSAQTQQAEYWTDVETEFTLKDIGSEIIDQLSSDIYTGPDSVLRELVKNAYDAYIALDFDEVDDNTQRVIALSRLRDENDVGHLYIHDNGVGQTLADLKGNVQISISHKQQDLANATGFRGLGSWASLGAGSQIIITSSKFGDPRKVRLELNVREIYSRLSPERSLDEILNEPKCIKFSEEASPEFKSQHFTTVDVVCDGKPQKVKGYEINRLYEHTVPEDPKLREIIVNSCPLPFAADTTIYEKLKIVYQKIGYMPTGVNLDGKPLERRIPASLSEITIKTLSASSQEMAIVWFAENPRQTGEVSDLDEEKHLIGGPSIQLLKYNVPVGEKGKFGDNVRANILNWYVGEVHVLADEVRPDAGGHNFRAGTAREFFIQTVREFYEELETRAEDKSFRLSLIKTLNAGAEAAKQLKKSALTNSDRAKLEVKVATAVEKVEALAKKAKPKTELEKKFQAAKSNEEVEAARKQAATVFKGGGHTQQYKRGATTPPPAPKPTSAKKGVQAKEGRTPILYAGVLQARLGRAVPEFKKIGLTQDQIEKVLAIFEEIITGAK